MPLVSVILPTHNGARFIARAIGSVQAQSARDWELLVVDDGSTDTTREIVSAIAESDARIRLVANSANLGIQKTLNRGLAEASGKWVARIDDDDIWTDPEKLAAQVAYIEAHPHTVVVGTWAIVVNEDGNEIYRYRLPRTDAAVRRSILAKNPFSHSAVLFSRARALEAGGYGEGADVRHVEDHDLWLRLGTKGEFANLPRYSVSLTAWPGSLSARNRHEQFDKGRLLIGKYRDMYPGWHSAMLRAKLRLWLHRFFKYLPAPLGRAFLRLYKRFW